MAKHLDLMLLPVEILFLFCDFSILDDVPLLVLFFRLEPPIQNSLFFPSGLLVLNQIQKVLFQFKNGEIILFVEHFQLGIDPTPVNSQDHDPRRGDLSVL